jgi:hypothetical protein
VAGDVMLLVVLRLRAFQELRMDILEALRANPGDADLRAQFKQAQQDVVVMMAELRALEAQWGFERHRRCRNRQQRHNFN